MRFFSDCVCPKGACNSVSGQGQCFSNPPSHQLPFSSGVPRIHNVEALDVCVAFPFLPFDHRSIKREENIITFFQLIHPPTNSHRLLPLRNPSHFLPVVTKKMITTQTAKTQYVNAANRVKFAYRRIGRATGIPLVMHIHFRGSMDFWDPALINALGAARPVIIFDQAGVGRSNGAIPTSFQEWADDLIAFVTALGITQIDLFGFSMGGAAVQMVALTAPKLVRRLILAGTSTSVPDDTVAFVPGIVWPREIPPTEPLRVLATAVTPEEIEHSLAYSFFPEDTTGRAAAKEYWNRIQERNVTDEPRMLKFIDKDVGAKRQLATFGEWSKHNPRNAWDRLGELKMPVLVMNGDNDVLIPSSRSWELMQMIPGGQLVIYPHAGHGFLYQYAELVAKHVNMFLGGNEYGELEAKL